MDNDKFQQYIQNFNRRVRYSGSGSAAKIDQSSYQFTEFYRDSRHAFGTRFQVEKQSHDYWYVIATLVVIAVIIWMRLS